MFGQKWGKLEGVETSIMTVIDARKHKLGWTARKWWISRAQCLRPWRPRVYSFPRENLAETNAACAAGEITGKSGAVVSSDPIPGLASFVSRDKEEFAFGESLW